MARRYGNSRALGIGGPCQLTGDPNQPTFDPAESTKRDEMISKILSTEDTGLNEWELNFLGSIYGIPRMSSKQRRVYIGILMKVKEAAEDNDAA